MLALQRLRLSIVGPELVEGPPLLLALDLPTGLNPDTGEIDPVCPRFDVTMALGYPKAGLLRFPGAEHAGRLRVLDIGIPPGLPEEQSVDTEMLTPGWVAEQLPPRPLDSHKGTYGHALVAVGSRHYVGAAWLASQASVRAGAGLTTLASPEGVYPIAAAKSAEAIHLPLPEDAAGRIAPSAATVLLNAVHPEAVEGRAARRRFTAALIGCGMGWSEGTTEFLHRLLCNTEDRLDGLPVLIDADGLNNLSGIENWHSQVNGPLVLTPHPGEMSTLTGIPVGDPYPGQPRGGGPRVGRALGRYSRPQGSAHRHRQPRPTRPHRPLRQPRPRHRRHRRRPQRRHRRPPGPGTATARGRRLWRLPPRRRRAECHRPHRPHRPGRLRPPGRPASIHCQPTPCYTVTNEY